MRLLAVPAVLAEALLPEVRAALSVFLWAVSTAQRNTQLTYFSFVLFQFEQSDKNDLNFDSSLAFQQYLRH